jgi:hypothetical protein
VAGWMECFQVSCIVECITAVNEFLKGSYSGANCGGDGWLSAQRRYLHS